MQIHRIQGYNSGFAWATMKASFVICWVGGTQLLCWLSYELLGRLFEIAVLYDRKRSLSSHVRDRPLLSSLSSIKQKYKLYFKHIIDIVFLAWGLGGNIEAVFGLYIQMSRANEEPKLTLDQEINLIFRTVFQKPINLKPKTFAKIRECMKNNLQEIVNDALTRAVRRDASLSTLEAPDLLWAVEKRGEKYKLKIGKSVVTANTFSEFGEKKMIVNYDEEGEQMDEENQKGG